ncbi:hypothetical protein [Collimonas sp.]|uniref:hypothetical protein n=1 Tax=Collimonas sp. TaxID=1963772 RepID=UPI002BDDE0AA|nr:hypothetical protein [Collimonas sp.]HWW08395.1 hypothetical protein [Collimonas sp.]
MSAIRSRMSGALATAARAPVRVSSRAGCWLDSLGDAGLPGGARRFALLADP